VIQRLALFLGGIAAAAVIAVALAVAGYGPSPAVEPAATPLAVDQMQPVVDATAQDLPVGDQALSQPITQVDTVYVQPAPTPATIRIVKAAPTKPPVIVHKVVRVAAANAPKGGAEADDQNEGESD
jgi:hypothetical protein